MASAFQKDIRRTVAQSRKRFVSILVICALGVTMVTGLRASCVDLRESADAFFDSQHLYDLSVQSTLGLTDDDVDALAAVEGVETARGSWEESTYTGSGTARASVKVQTLREGMNEPYLLEGTLPERAGEVVVTQNYLDEAHAQIGDTVTLESGDNEVFSRDPYTIVGVAIDPAELTNPSGSIAIRASASADYSFYVNEASVVSDAYTVAYVSVAGTEALLCYSDAYTDAVAAVSARVEALADEREQARTAQVKHDAAAEVDDAEAKAQREFDDAEAALAEAQASIDEGWNALSTSEAELENGQRQLEAGRSELDAQASQLAASAAQLKDGLAQIDDGLAQIADGQAQVKAGQHQVEAGLAQIDAGQAALDAQRAQVNARFDADEQNAQARFDAGEISQDELDAARATLKAQRSSALAALDHEQDTLDANRDALARQASSLEQQAAELAETQSALTAQRAQLEGQQQRLAAGKTQLEDARAALAASRNELAQGARQLEDGKRELADGQAELDAQRDEYESSKADALAQIADARTEIDDIENARWYVQDRSSNAGYTSVESDASSIEAIGFVFPVVFIIVAVLIGLTTITRMVEEERSLIGTYKSLGYGNRTIVGKYALYALAACLIGGLLGEFCGFVLFPAFLFTVFEMMYLLPNYLLTFDTLYGVGSFLFFAVGIVGAALMACRSELAQTPAALMRPKAPQAGSRVFLERITPVWSRLSFLNKVTTRNLLRYKKRFFMTVFGIAGCMALLICGFAIKDSVHALSGMQYGDINRYDVLAVVSADDFDDARESLENDPAVDELLPLSVDSVTLSTGGGKESLQLFVVPDKADLSAYVALRTSPGNPCALNEDGLALSRNAAELLGVQDGDTLHLKTSALDEADAPVAHVVDYYLGNAAYVTASCYETLFSEAAEANGFYLNLSDTTDQQAFADDLAQRDGFMSVSSTQEMSDEFSQAFALINTVVYVIIVLAAALAFVVLFTLSTTNISERVRELATIKVLGFRRREVNHYVNKETILLTLIGIVVGLPLGYAFSNSLTAVLKMPSIYFAVTIEPISYGYAAALTLVFAFIVALLSNRALQKINMIEALKSVE